MRTPWRLMAIPALAAFPLVAASCGGDDSPSSAATTVTTTAPTTAAAAATTAPTTAAGSASTAAPATTGTEEPAAGDTVELTLKVGVDDSPDRVEAVKLGQSVVITMQSDQDEEYHLHGYELEQKAAAGTEAVFSFTADRPGRFDLESHVTDEVLLVLDVS